MQQMHSQIPENRAIERVTTKPPLILNSLQALAPLSLKGTNYIRHITISLAQANRLYGLFDYMHERCFTDGNATQFAILATFDGWLRAYVDRNALKGSTAAIIVKLSRAPREVE
jgi:hypothetical protein